MHDDFRIGDLVLDEIDLRFDYGEPVLSSCTSTSGEGYSGYRYDTLLGGFDNSASANICAPEQFSDALEGISSLILTSIEGRCLQAALPTCSIDADCETGACTPRGTAGMFCDSEKVQVEVTRPVGVGGFEGAQCAPLADGSQRCILSESSQLAFSTTFWHSS